MYFIRLRKFLSIPNFLTVFIIIGWEISTSIDMAIWFFFYSIVTWWITLIAFWILNQHCISGINPTCLWCIILFVYWWIISVNTCQEFLHLYSWAVLVCSVFFSWTVFVYIWHQDNTGFIEWGGKCSVFCFMEKNGLYNV